MNTTIEAMIHGWPHRFAPAAAPEPADDEQQQADVHRPDGQLPDLEQRLDDDRVALTPQAERHERRGAVADREDHEAQQVGEDEPGVQLGHRPSPISIAGRR